MFGAFGPAYCECGPNADWFLQEWFSDCIYTTWELVAFWIGISSVLFWIVAQLPQFISNLKNQTAEALSPWFLLQWLAGDSFNLLKCILTGDQLATQTFTATYFIFADCVIISQYIYYSMRENEEGPFEEKEQVSSTLPRDYTSESEDVEVNDEAQQEGHQNHPDTSVTGRSGAAMISHAMHSPQALPSPHVEHTNKAFQTSASMAIAHSPGRCRPKGNSLQPNPNAQYHPVSHVTDRSDALTIAHDLHSPKAPHNPHMDHINGASLTITPTSSARSPERGRSTDVGLQGNPNGQCQTSGTSKGRVEALLGRSDRRTGQFQSLKEQDQQNRISAARLGSIPEITVEHLFPTAHAMKRHLRRLVNQYGLECGPPSVSRLTIHHVKSLGKHEVEKHMGATLTAKLGSGFKKRPGKAAACLASLLTVRTSANVFQKSGALGPSHALAIGSRRLLADTRYPGPGGATSRVSSTVKIGRKLLLICGDGERPWWLRSFGNCLGWGSSGLYFGSRFSHIIMNYQRRSAEGLSLAMLSCAVLANTCMGVSILMRAKSLEDLANKAPWLLGSMGTVSLDLFILLQAKYLDARCAKSAQIIPDERTYLLA